MKISKKNITGAIIFCILLSLSANTAFSIVDNSSKNEKNKQESIQYAYTNNEIHSIFTIKDCIELAVKYNPNIQSYIYNEDIYKSKIGQAWANYFPKLSAGFDVSRSGTRYSKDLYPGYNGGYITMGYIPNVSGDMLIFDFGKTKANADMAKRKYEASKENTKENINTIIYDIKSTYFNVLFAQAQVKVYEDTVQDYELQLSQAWGFYNLGKKAKIDVVTAEYNLGKAKLNLVKAKNILEVAQVELSKIMGIPEYTNYELSDELSLKSYDDVFENIIKTALDVRPELIAAKKSADAAMLNLRLKKRNLTPDLGIFASYGNGLGNDYNLTSSKFGVGMSYNSLNLMSVKKQIDEAKANYKKSLADYDNVKHKVYLNVKKEYITVQTAKEEIIIAKLALKQAFEQYRQATGRYKAGIGDAIELKDGENTYLNARLDFYNAMLNYNVAIAGLEKEIGVPLKLSDEDIIDSKDL